MLSPAKTKYKKQHKGKNRGYSKGGTEISFGTIALLADGRGFLSSKQIEAARVAMTRYVKRDGAIWIRIFPNKPITRKPAEVRMGKGKGSVDSWVSVIKPGRILYEIDGIKESIARKAFRLAAAKLPFSIKIITIDREL